MKKNKHFREWFYGTNNPIPDLVNEHIRADAVENYLNKVFTEIKKGIEQKRAVKAEVNNIKQATPESFINIYNDAIENCLEVIKKFNP